MRVTFHGAAQTVTGSKHLITTEGGHNILLDCGMFQGMGAEGGELNRHFNFNPADIDWLILSHAHIDHSGLIPRLVREGFDGEIYCTPATLDLCRLMLMDSASIQVSDLKYVNRRRAKRGDPVIEPLYDEDDAERSLKLFRPVEYRQWKKLNNEIAFMFTDSGHVLGSGAINLIINERGKDVKLCFTADIGRPGDLILKKPEAFPQAAYIICESTYGDRLHEPVTDAEAHLLREVIRTCVTQKGKLIIPAFSLDRTQELVYALDRMAHAGKLPPIKVFVDSPLSVEVTRIVEKHIECYNSELRNYMTKGDNQPFYFRNLHYISEVEDSKMLNDLKEPCIIISASGMAEAGRIKHHISNNIGNPDNTILIVGYCTPTSLGARLKAGDPVVRIFGKEYDVIARVASIEAYSAHGDYSEMIGYLKCQNPNQVKKLFLVHGEPEVMVTFSHHLERDGWKNIIIPQRGESFEIH